MFKTHDTLKIMSNQNDNTAKRKIGIKLKRDTSSGTVIADVYCIYNDKLFIEDRARLEPCKHYIILTIVVVN